MSDLQGVIDQVSEAQMSLDDTQTMSALVAAQAELERLQDVVENLRSCNVTLCTDGRKAIAIADSEAEAKDFYFAVLDVRNAAQKARSDNG